MSRKVHAAEKEIDHQTRMSLPVVVQSFLQHLNIKHFVSWPRVVCTLIICSYSFSKARLLYELLLKLSALIFLAWNPLLHLLITFNKWWKDQRVGTWTCSQMRKRVSCHPRALISCRRWLSEHVCCVSALVLGARHHATCWRTRSVTTCVDSGSLFSSILPVGLRWQQCLHWLTGWKLLDPFLSLLSKFDISSRDGIVQETTFKSTLPLLCGFTTAKILSTAHTVEACGQFLKCNLINILSLFVLWDYSSVLITFLTCFQLKSTAVNVAIQPGEM